MDVTLDRETLKALAAPMRAGMLKLLLQRRHTQTELAQALGIAVPTAKEHVEALARAGLVEVHEEGRKWKYCSLTRKARAILNPEEQRIILLLALAILSAAGALLAFAGRLLIGGFGVAKMAAAPLQEAAFGAARTPAPALLALTPGTAWLTVLLTLAAVFGILAFHYWQRNREARKRLLHG